MKLIKLSKSFNGLKVLENFSLDLKGSGVTCFLGPSGCGKSTLMHIIAGIMPQDSGEISGKPEKISVVFQDGRLLPWLGALGNAACVREASGQKAAELLAALEITETEKLPAELSGGMRQRVNIARALNYDFELLILDEPFKGLDADLKKTAASVIMKELGGRPALLITHDMDEALMMCGEIVTLEGPPLKIV